MTAFVAGGSGADIGVVGLVDLCAKREQEVTLGIELLNTTIFPVEHVHVALRVDCDASDGGELARAATFDTYLTVRRGICLWTALLELRRPTAYAPAPRPHERTPGVELVDPGVDLIGDVKVAGLLIDGKATGNHTLPSPSSVGLSLTELRD
ncbi:MAG TPA: hypothetical protein VFX85_11125 [Solirubrobacterales bacterium]|nr:hypothetical protein [Solirubrobacterales bacterium]